MTNNMWNILTVSISATEEKTEKKEEGCNNYGHGLYIFLLT